MSHEVALRNVGYFAYSPGVNPYQKLFRTALSSRGTSVVPIEPATLFPLRRAIRSAPATLHFDWIHDLYIGRNAFAQLLKRLMYSDGIRALRSTHNVWTVHNLVAHDSSLDADLHRRLIQQFVDVCGGLMFLSKSSIELFRQEYTIPEATKIEATRIGHFADYYPNVEGSAEARRSLGIDPQSRVGLLFGRVHPYKGVEDLIAAFYKMSTSRDLLIVAGKPASAAYARELQDLVGRNESSGSGRILLALRSVDDAEVQRYYNAADVAILPFKKILNSASFMLAKTFGCPVLAPNIGSLGEYAAPEVDILYPHSAALVEVMVDAFNRFEHDAAADRRARIETTRRQFSWDHVASAACRLYDGACTG